MNSHRPSTSHTAQAPADDWGFDPPAAPPPPQAAAPPRPRTHAHTFGANIEIAEIDERGRPRSVWTARARELSRSGLTFMSRRMAHVGRTLLVAVHLIDDKPVPLFGRVTECEYEADGLHRVSIEFQHLPDSEAIRQWIEARHQQRRRETRGT